MADGGPKILKDSSYESTEAHHPDGPFDLRFLLAKFGVKSGYSLNYLLIGFGLSVK